MKRRLISAFMVFALAFGAAQAVFADENETTLKQGEVKIEKQRHPAIRFPLIIM